MTKEQFESGLPFKIISKIDYKGASTFKYDEGCIIRQTRSSIDETVLYDAYHLNVKKIGRVGFEGFVFVMSKKVNIKHKFEELMVFEE